MSNRLNEELHPLQNVEVLSRIFSFSSSVNDLKNYRLVGSKLWLKASMNSWRGKAVLKITPNPKPEPDNDGVNLPGINFPELQNICNDERDPYDLRRKPFKNIKLEGFDHLHPEQSELKWILDRFSHQIYRIAFKDCKFQTLHAFLDTILFELPNLFEVKLDHPFSVGPIGSRSRNDGEYHLRHENLKSVILDNAVFSDDGFPLVDFCIVLRSIAGLQHLQVKSLGRAEEVDNNGKGVMSTVAVVRDLFGPTFLQLKSLDIVSVPLTGTGFTGGRNFQLDASMPLERFRGTMENVLYLKPYMGTLKYLDVIFKDYNRDESTSEDGKISLPNLKECHAHGSPVQVFQNLNKVEALELDTLVVDHPHPPEEPESSKTCQIASIHIHLRNSSFRNVTRLECYHSSKMYLIDSKDFESLSRSMPNVIHAKMPLSRMAFRKLCEVWRHILTLTISESNAKHKNNDKLVDDEAITGNKPNAELPLEGDRPANITNLKKLTDFENFTRLTDHSVNFGFLQLPRLHYLNVGFEKISKEAELALRRKVHILEIG